MLECPNCKKDMNLDEYETFFRENDTEVILHENYWCPTCDINMTKLSYFKKYHEEIREENK